MNSLIEFFPLQPCIIFAGDKFESVPALALAKSLLLDMFRGEPVGKINLAGIDRVLMAGEQVLGQTDVGQQRCMRVDKDVELFPCLTPGPSLPVYRLPSPSRTG